MRIRFIISLITLLISNLVLPSNVKLDDSFKELLRLYLNEKRFSESEKVIIVTELDEDNITIYINRLDTTFIIIGNQAVPNSCEINGYEILFFGESIMGLAEFDVVTKFSFFLPEVDSLESDLWQIMLYKDLSFFGRGSFFKGVNYHSTNNYRDVNQIFSPNLPYSVPFPDTLPSIPGLSYDKFYSYVDSLMRFKCQTFFQNHRFNAAVVVFDVDERGLIRNAHLYRSTRIPELDSCIMNVINDLPQLTVPKYKGDSVILEGMSIIFSNH